MFIAFSRVAFANVLLLTLAVSAWAADEKQAPPAKAEKMGEMEKKPETGKMTKGTEENRKLQEALKPKGNDPGPIDGRIDPKTWSVLKAFQEADGLKEYGTLDDQTAEKLGLQRGAIPRSEETNATKKEGTDP
jgi:peptidoglycan hydrolase-like protein with peptidoglycan-binding domain